MGLSLTCACGARFEVEDTFAGQAIPCPDCQQPLAVPVPSREPVRTSGYALASVLSALVFAFTGIGTLLAILLGLMALGQIRRHRGQVAGKGYALFGIIAGTVFTALFALAVIKAEFFAVGDQLREQFLSAKVDRSGPLEVKRLQDGYAITRPSPKWGIARDDLADELLPEGGLTLLNVGRDACITVTTDWRGNRSLEQYRDDLLNEYRTQQTPLSGLNGERFGVSDLKIRQTRRLPVTRGLEGVEVLFDVRISNLSFTFLTRIVKTTGNRDDKVYIIRGWTQAWRFAPMEEEVRRGLDSFRLLP